jgi:tetratricopeptide (TPR) repeat protein
MQGKTATLAALLALGAFPLLVPAASAQQPARLNLARDERASLAALQTAASGQDRPAQDAALAAARAAAHSADARYALAHLQFEIGRSRGDAAMQGQAADAMIESGLARPEEMPSLIANQASRAFYAGDVNRADALLARAVQLDPNNASLLADAAQIHTRIALSLSRARRTAEAQTAIETSIAYLQRAIEIQQRSGQPAPESWYQRGLDLAFDNRLGPQAAMLGRGLVGAYPNPVNWRDALLAMRELAPADPVTEIELRRLMRASESLGGERDYVETAEALNRAGLAGEAKAVLDEGVARGMLAASKPAVAALIVTSGRGATAGRAALAGLRTRAMAAATGAAAHSAGDAYYGYGQYAEAAELYRAALQKGGEDAGLVNLRLGASLALAGRRPEAEAALRAVAGPRADLAAFWLAWLSRRPA